MLDSLFFVVEVVVSEDEVCSDVVFSCFVLETVLTFFVTFGEKNDIRDIVKQTFCSKRV